jgi:hypothetical protein
MQICGGHGGLNALFFDKPKAKQCKIKLINKTQNGINARHKIKPLEHATNHVL